MPNPTHRGQGNARHSTEVADRVISRGQTSPYDINGAPTGASIADGDYGDIVVSGSGAVMEFDPAVVAAYARTLLAAADAAAARAVLAAQEAHALLSALAAMGASTGLVEQTGAATFAKRAIGAAAATDILSRGDGDGRYVLSATYTAADVLAKLLTVDGPGSGLDADTLDGMSSAAFATAAHTHIIADVTGLLAALDAKLDDTQATAFGLSLLDDADAAAARTTLGLGTAATQNTGTSGATIPLLNGANTWSGINYYGSASLFRGTLAGLAGAAGGVMGYVNAAGFGAIFYGRDPSTGNNTNVRIAGSGLTFAIGASGDGTVRMTISATGIDVTGLVQCDTFRLDAASTAGAVAGTHTVPISINGVAARMIVAIP